VPNCKLFVMLQILEHSTRKYFCSDIPIEPNRHLNCYLEREEDDPVDRRVRNCLDKMKKCANRAKREDAQNEAALDDRFVDQNNCFSYVF